MGTLSERIKKINEATAEPLISRANTTVPKKESVKPPTVKPPTTKPFSDGSVRKWDDAKQEWVVTENERYKR